MVARSDTYVQIVRYIPLGSWFSPKFPSGELNFNNFHQVQRMIGGIGNHVGKFWQAELTIAETDLLYKVKRMIQ